MEGGGQLGDDRQAATAPLGVGEVGVEELFQAGQQFVVLLLAGEELAVVEAVGVVQE